ncbi:DUF3095 domain-containing protein [Bdellovibrio sp. BCCA]|uniref:DUF3095 domain-containing protein n=1 Tax=Bdellovibrio sp. BCCA TaxID=3136281 RepID=UPI0030F348D2
MEKFKDFLKQVPSFDDFLHISDDKNFLTVPEDWGLILTDIKGSTKAVQSGRYREVNMVGAACITALLNEFNVRELPFVFGGDGATLLVPPEFKIQASVALKSVQAWSKKEFDLELRSFIFDLKEVCNEGCKLLLGKYQLSQGNVIYQFRGGALRRAEEKMKKGLGGLAIQASDDEIAPKLQGLTCRWEPLSTQKGTILTILVSAAGDEERSFDIYHRVLAGLREILGGNFKIACPTNPGSMKIKWPPKTLAIEAKSRPGKFIPEFFGAAIDSLIAFIMIRFNISAGGFDPRKYKSEIISNSDFQKYDDLLRMVLDCSSKQAQEIESLLKSFEERGEIVFGTHRSPQALMTCLVFSATQNQHLHFIDGAQGGYTLAAVDLKKKKTT